MQARAGGNLIGTRGNERGQGVLGVSLTFSGFGVFFFFGCIFLLLMDRGGHWAAGADWWQGCQYSNIWCHLLHFDSCFLRSTPSSILQPNATRQSRARTLSPAACSDLSCSRPFGLGPEWGMELRFRLGQRGSLLEGFVVGGGGSHAKQCFSFLSSDDGQALHVTRQPSHTSHTTPHTTAPVSLSAQPCCRSVGRAVGGRQVPHLGVCPAVLGDDDDDAPSDSAAFSLCHG